MLMLNAILKCKAKKKLYKIFANADLYNKNYNCYYIKKLIKKNYGWLCKLQVPEGLDFNYVLSKRRRIENGFPCLVEADKRPGKISNVFDLKLITKNFKKKEFEILDLKPNELFFGYSISGDPLIIDMNTFPGLLIAGQPGSGKTRLELCMLFNSMLANPDMVEFYLIQIRKYDFNCLKNFKQVKSCCFTLQEAEKTLKFIDELTQKREKLFKDNNAINIADYNKKRPKNKLPYIYCGGEELAFFMKDSSDDPELQEMKDNCLKRIKNIIMAGRSAGIFMILTLQRSTADNLPPTIKNLLVNKITFAQGNELSSKNIIENDMAIGLGKQECIYYNGSTYKRLISPFLSDKKINELSKRGSTKDIKENTKTEEKKLVYTYKAPEKKELTEEEKKLIRLEMEADEQLKLRKEQREFEKEKYNKLNREDRIRKEISTEPFKVEKKDAFVPPFPPLGKMEKGKYKKRK